LYKIPPPADWRIQPIDENKPKIPATICPWENIAMVLISPAEPAAVLSGTVSVYRRGGEHTRDTNDHVNGE
jgi:hypothetical protein